MKKFIILLAALLVILAGTFTGYRISNSRSFQFFGGIINRVDTEEKVVALTFDDGPAEKTEEILELLEKLDVKVTFFVTGRELEENKEAGEKIVQAGHELRNHTYSHNRMVFKLIFYIKKEIKLTDKLIKEVGYQGDIHFRPPNAKKLFALPYVLKQENRKTIMWDLEPDSYPEIASSSAKIVDHVVENISPGSIILLHVMYESRVDSLSSLEGIVDELRAKGYTFKKVSELLEYK